jgi:hypothetical protein
MSAAICFCFAGSVLAREGVAHLLDLGVLGPAEPAAGLALGVHAEVADGVRHVRH